MNTKRTQKKKKKRKLNKKHQSANGQLNRRLQKMKLKWPINTKKKHLSLTSHQRNEIENYEIPPTDALGSKVVRKKINKIHMV